MRSFSVALIAAVLFSLSACSLRADSPKVGSMPPEIKLDQWISPEADTKDKPILLEFWATWCPPCRKSIPHLNEIHDKYKDKGLVIIGVSNEDAAKVSEFQKGTPMNYPNGVSKSLIGAYGVSGIPHAFLIGKDGKVLWEGHPMSLNDKIIDGALK